MLVIVGAAGTVAESEIEKLSTPAVASLPDSSVSFQRIYRYWLFPQFNPESVVLFAAPPMRNSGEMATCVPGAPVPVLGVVKLKSELLVHVPAESFIVPAPEPLDVVTPVLLTR